MIYENIFKGISTDVVATPAPQTTETSNISEPQKYDVDVNRSVPKVTVYVLSTTPNTQTGKENNNNNKKRITHCIS
jgi:hypothetical protein